MLKIEELEYLTLQHKEVISMMGTCTGCGTENVEVNEAGLCAACAAAPAAPSTEGMETPAETPTEGAM